VERIQNLRVTKCKEEAESEYTKPSCH